MAQTDLSNIWSDCSFPRAATDRQLHSLILTRCDDSSVCALSLKACGRRCVVLFLQIEVDWIRCYGSWFWDCMIWPQCFKKCQWPSLSSLALILLFPNQHQLCVCLWKCACAYKCVHCPGTFNKWKQLFLGPESSQPKAARWPAG